jgi:hypothetical protein
MTDEQFKELEKIVGQWYHKRDRGYYIREDGKEELLWDSGCDRFCKKCQMEKWLAKVEREK